MDNAYIRELSYYNYTGNIFTMKAMTLDKNLNFVWKELADPIRKDGEILIKIHAAAINRADIMQKDGCYASPPEWPQWCGLEASGEVIEVPENSKFRPGDKVCALLGGGGYSQMISVPEGMVIPVPENLSMIEAAAIPEVWATVCLNMEREAGGLTSNDTLYIQAGASGIGLAAIQYAKLKGAKVIASAGTQEKIEFIRNLGADIVFNYKEADENKILADNPPTVALDCVGGRNMGNKLNYMAFGGRWIMIASLAGGNTEINLEQIWRKRLKLIGSTLRSRSNEEKSAIMQSIHRELSPFFSSGKLKNHIHGVFPISEVEAAQAVLRRAENIGKVVLTLD